MKKSLTFLLLLAFSISIDIQGANAASPEVKAVHQIAMKSDNKLPMPSWSFEFQNNDRLYQEPITEIDIHSQLDAKERFYRMLHALYLKPNNTKDMLDRAHSVSSFIPQIISHVNKKMHVSGKVQHISIYGSFLYNMVDPDDVDILIIVDSPNPVFEHADVDSKLITGSDKFPKFSLQVIDYNTYQTAVSHFDSENLPRSEKLALQHIAVGSAWYFTIYGFDFRFDNPNSLKQNTKANYLNKSIVSLNSAGARLYKSAYSYLPFESEKIRLRKVVSRILITDFLIPVLDTSVAATPSTYTMLYNEIRQTKDSDKKKWKDLESRIQNLYFKKLEQLLTIAEKHGKLNEIKFSDK